MPRLMGFKERHMEVRRCKSDASFVVPHDHQWVFVGVLAVPQEVPLLGDLQILLNDRICYTASLAALAQAFERRNPSELTKILARCLEEAQKTRAQARRAPTARSTDRHPRRQRADERQADLPTTRARTWYARLFNFFLGRLLGFFLAFRKSSLSDVAKVVDAAAEAWIKYQRVSTETMTYPIVVNSQGLVEFRADTPCEIEFNILKTVPVQ